MARQRKLLTTINVSDFNHYPPCINVCSDEFDDESEESALFEVILHRCCLAHFVLECVGLKVTPKGGNTE